MSLPGEISSTLFFFGSNPGLAKNSKMVLLTGRTVYHILSPHWGIRVSSRVKTLGAAGANMVLSRGLMTSSILNPSVSPQEMNCLPSLIWRLSLGERSNTASQGTPLVSL